MKALLALLLLASTAAAATIEFVPPYDSGQVYSGNANDGYSDGRGLVFAVEDVTTINSVGIWHDLTTISLTFELSVFAGPDAGTVLRSGGSTVTTQGLEWIDYAFAPVTFVPMTTYHLEFSHSGAGNQNFFYHNGFSPWAQDGFITLDGTQDGSGANTVVAAMRVSTIDVQSVPDAGSTIGLVLLSVAALGGARRRR